MSMSTYVDGFKPPDDKWHRMKAAWDACNTAGVNPPREVLDFFEGENPDNSGVKVDLWKHPSVTKWSEDCREGYEVDLRKLPTDVTVLRFYNSW